MLSRHNRPKMSQTITSYHNKTTGNLLTPNYTATAVLPWIHRSQVSQTNTTSNDRTTKMLSRFYRSQMSQTTNNYRTTKMLSRIYRYKMS